MSTHFIQLTPGHPPVWAIKKPGLPEISERAENLFVKAVPKFSPYASQLKTGGNVLTAASFTYETYACYNKPGN